MPFWKSVILAFYDGQRVFYKQKPHQTIYIAFDEKNVIYSESSDEKKIIMQINLSRCSVP